MNILTARNHWRIYRHKRNTTQPNPKKPGGGLGMNASASWLDNLPGLQWKCSSPQHCSKQSLIITRYLGRPKYQKKVAGNNITCSSQKMNILTARNHWRILPPQTNYDPAESQETWPKSGHESVRFIGQSQSSKTSMKVFLTSALQQAISGHISSNRCFGFERTPT